MTKLFLAVLIFAFPADQYWHMPAAGNVPNGATYDSQAPSGTNRAGAGGIYGTGGAKDYGIKCSHCHIEGNPAEYGLIDVTFTEAPAWQTLTTGEDAYVPGTQYVLTFELIGEHRGNPTGPPGNQNGIGVAIEDGSGNTAGVYVTDSGERSDACDPSLPSTLDPVTQTTFVYGDCHGVLFVAGPNTNRTLWKFDWVAPAAGTGDVTIFYSVVDGDTGGDGSLDDDVKEGTIVIREGS